MCLKKNPKGVVICFPIPSLRGLLYFHVIARRETPRQSVHPQYVIARNRRFRGNLLKGVVPSQDCRVAVAPRDDDYGDDTKQKNAP